MLGDVNPLNKFQYLERLASTIKRERYSGLLKKYRKEWVINLAAKRNWKFSITLVTLWTISKSKLLTNTHNLYHKHPNMGLHCLEQKCLQFVIICKYDHLIVHMNPSKSTHESKWNITSSYRRFKTQKRYNIFIWIF